MLILKKYYSLKQLQKFVIVLVFLLLSISIKAQFAPPVGQEGTTAIKADSSIIIGWANNCIVQRGFINIGDTSLGFASFGADSLVQNIADNAVVSLGDAGSAIITFETPLVNGAGFDFAVFENSFLDDFLELAFVEVSSDGQNFFRFNSNSLTQTTEQVGTFGLLDASKINNLAGKYRGGYGTPFDLEELKDIPKLDINNIRAIKIVDVIGSITEEYATYDSQGNAINDPWPTPFESSGFDLDAVGVIHDKEHMTVGEFDEAHFNVYPNPFSTQLQIKGLPENSIINILDIMGRIIFSKSNIKQEVVTIEGSNLPKGLLFLHMSKDGFSTTKKIFHN